MRDAASMTALVLAVALSLLSACAGRPENTIATEVAEESDMVEDLYVNSQLVDCEGVAPQQCMQVRRSPHDDWELFYGQIEGFSFEPGFTYKLLVRVTPAASVPADASSLRYALVEVVEKTPA